MKMELRIERLLHALRVFGATMVASAAGTFLFQRWDDVGDVSRYFALLGVTAALPMMAYLCGIRFGEGRSARVLLVTVLALVPIHAGILAALVFSQFGAGHPNIAAAALWVAPSPLAAVLVVAGATLVLVPLLWSAYRVLARSHARVLAAGSVLLHGLLLVPSRSALSAILLLVPMVTIAAAIGARLEPRTREARIAVASLFGPALLLLGRQLLFYDTNATFWGFALAIAATLTFTLGRRLESPIVTRLSVVPTLLSTLLLWTTVCGEVFPGWGWSPSAGTELLTYGWFATLPLGLAAWRSGASRSFFLGSIVAVQAIVIMTAMLIEPTTWVALEAIALGLGIASYGYLRERPLALYVGGVILAPGVVLEVREAIEHFQPGGWLALAGFGIGLVGLTAWLERRVRARRFEDDDSVRRTPLSESAP